MKRFRINFQLTKEGKKAVACAVAGAAVLALLLFFILFRVSRVEIVGSTKYTDDEIREYALGNPVTSNTLLAVWFQNHIEAEDIPFIESFDLERLDRHTIRIHVNEKKIVGYVVQGTDKLYFDKDGLVVELETMNAEEITQMEEEAEELEALKAEAEREEALQKARGAEEALTGKVQEEGEEGEEGEEQEATADTQILQAEEVSGGNENATEFHAAVTDVPRVIGLTKETVALDKKISTEDITIFNTILGITRMVEKYQILPEIVYFDEENEITLVYQQGTIHCRLGKDTLLEEKITRVAAILPKLENLTGILHLESYTTDTTNIIFSKESLYTLKSIIAAVANGTEAAASGDAADAEGTGAAQGEGTEAGGYPEETTGGDGNSSGESVGQGENTGSGESAGQEGNTENNQTTGQGENTGSGETAGQGRNAESGQTTGQEGSTGTSQTTGQQRNAATGGTAD